MSGAELLDAVNLEYELPENRVSQSKLYLQLDGLAERGFVEKRERDGRTKEYPLTLRGRRRLASYGEWVRRNLDAGD